MFLLSKPVLALKSFPLGPESVGREDGYLLSKEVRKPSDSEVGVVVVVAVAGGAGGGAPCGGAAVSKSFVEMEDAPEGPRPF